jgi:hypothetical protein
MSSSAKCAAPRSSQNVRRYSRAWSRSAGVARRRRRARPYSVQLSPETGLFRYRAILRHTYFLGIMLRLELELPSGLILRSRMTKEEYSALGLRDGIPVSFQIRQYRVLGTDGELLQPEVSVVHDLGANLGAGI